MITLDSKTQKVYASSPDMSFGTSTADLFKNPSDFTENLRWWGYVRWLSTISFLAIGIIQMAINQIEIPPYSFIFILLGIVLLNFFYSYSLENFKITANINLILNTLDVTIFSLSIYLTGGIKSPLIWLYLVPILTSSITVGRMIGLFATSLSLLGLFFMFFFSEVKNYENNLELSESIKSFLISNGPEFISYTCLFFLVYFISSSLAETLREQNKVLAYLNSRLEHKNKEMERMTEVLAVQERKKVVSLLSRTFRHELNNPLTILCMNTEMLLKDDPNTMRERIDIISDTIMRIKNVTSKIESLYDDSASSEKDLEILDLDNPERKKVEYFKE